MLRLRRQPGELERLSGALETTRRSRRALKSAEKADATRVPAGRAPIRCAALRFPVLGPLSLSPPPQFHTSESSCPLQGTVPTSCKFLHCATTAVVSVLRFAADADLLWLLAALLFAIGQVFTVASRSWLFHFVATASPALW